MPFLFAELFSIALEEGNDAGRYRPMASVSANARSAQIPLNNDQLTTISA